MKDLAFTIGLLAWIFFGVIAYVLIGYLAFSAAIDGEWTRGCFWVLTLIFLKSMDAKGKL